MHSCSPRRMNAFPVDLKKRFSIGWSPNISKHLWRENRIASAQSRSSLRENSGHSSNAAFRPMGSLCPECICQSSAGSSAPPGAKIFLADCSSSRLLARREESVRARSPADVAAVWRDALLRRLTEPSAKTCACHRSSRHRVSRTRRALDVLLPDDQFAEY